MAKGGGGGEIRTHTDSVMNLNICHCAISRKDGSENYSEIHFRQSTDYISWQQNCSQVKFDNTEEMTKHACTDTRVSHSCFLRSKKKILDYKCMHPFDAALPVYIEACDKSAGCYNPLLPPLRPVRLGADWILRLSHQKCKADSVTARSKGFKKKFF